MFKFRPEIAPDRHAVSRPPPRGQNHIQQKEHAQNGSGTHPKSDQQRNTDQQFDNPHYITEENGVRQNHLHQNRSIKADHTVGNVVSEISLEPAVGKPRTCHLILSKQKEKYGRGDAHASNGSRQSDRVAHQVGIVHQIRAVLAPGPVIGHILLEGIQFVTQVVDPPLQQVPDGKNPQQFAVVIGHR
jgi:hypothetical protein